MSSRKRGGFPEEAGISPRLEKDGYLSESALCDSGRYPKKAHDGGLFTRSEGDPLLREAWKRVKSALRQGMGNPTSVLQRLDRGSREGPMGSRLQNSH